MKQKDFSLIIVIAIVSGVISVFVSRALFNTPASKDQQVEVVQAITSDFKLPDEKYFNDQAINPTKNISIGGGTNPNPFVNTTKAK